MIRDESPCIAGCQNRTSRCKFDGSCSKYSDWKVLHEEKLKKYRLIKQTDDALTSLGVTRSERRCTTSTTRSVSQTR